MMDSPTSPAAAESDRHKLFHSIDCTAGSFEELRVADYQKGFVMPAASAAPAMESWHDTRPGTYQPALQRENGGRPVLIHSITASPHHAELRSPEELRMRDYARGASMPSLCRQTAGALLALGPCDYTASSLYARQTPPQLRLLHARQRLLLARLWEHRPATRPNMYVPVFSTAFTHTALHFK